MQLLSLFALLGCSVAAPNGMADLMGLGNGKAAPAAGPALVPKPIQPAQAADNDEVATTPAADDELPSTTPASDADEFPSSTIQASNDELPTAAPVNAILGASPRTDADEPAMESLTKKSIPRKGFQINRLIAERKLQYLNDRNTRHLLAQLTKLPVLKAVTSTYDANKDDKISRDEWNGFYEQTLAPYMKEKLSLEPVSEDMWAAVLMHGNYLSVTAHMFPTLHSMTTEEIFDALAAALFWEFDEDKNGYLNSSEWQKFKASPAYLPTDDFPFIGRRALIAKLRVIERAQGKDAACRVVKRFQTLGRPLNLRSFTC